MEKRIGPDVPSPALVKMKKNPVDSNLATSTGFFLAFFSVSRFQIPDELMYYRNILHVEHT